MNISRIISGGQTGIDQAALRFARSHDIPTGGTAPRLFLVETPDGSSFVPDPSLAEWGLVECERPAGEPPSMDDRAAWRRWAASCFPPRTERNVRDSDATLVFQLGAFHSPGTKSALKACAKHGRPPLVVCVHGKTGERGVGPEDAADWLAEHGVKVLNVGGNRYSTAPKLGAWAEKYLAAIFAILEGHH